MKTEKNNFNNIKLGEIDFFIQEFFFKDNLFHRKLNFAIQSSTYQ